MRRLFFARVDGVLLSCLQFLVMGVICTVLAFVYETPDLSAILSSWAPILYVAVMSSGVGYTLQILAQKDTSPVVASLLMSLESVFAVLAGWLLLDEALSARELLGCALMFAAVILAQLPPGLFRRRAQNADAESAHPPPAGTDPDSPPRTLPAEYRNNRCHPRPAAGRQRLFFSGRIPGQFRR